MAVDEHGRTEFLQAVSNNDFDEVSKALDNDSCAVGKTASCVLINRDEDGPWRPVVDNYQSTGLHLAYSSENENIADCIIGHLEAWHVETARTELITHVNDEDYSPLYLAMKKQFFGHVEILLDWLTFETKHVELITRYCDPAEGIKGYNLIMLAAYDGMFDLAERLMSLVSQHMGPKRLYTLLTEDISNRSQHQPALNEYNAQDDRLDSTRPTRNQENERYTFLDFLLQIADKHLYNGTPHSECEKILLHYVKNIPDVEGSLLNWEKIRNKGNSRIALEFIIENDLEQLMEVLLGNAVFVSLLHQKIDESDCWYKDWIYHMNIPARMRYFLYPKCPKFFLVPIRSDLTALLFYSSKHSDNKKNINDAHSEAESLQNALITRGFNVSIFPKNKNVLWRKAELLKWIQNELRLVTSTAGAVLLCGMTHGRYGYMNDSYLDTILIKEDLLELFNPHNNLVYEFVPKIVVVEACQRFYNEEATVTPPELDYDNMYLFCSARRGHMSHTNCAIAEMCKHVRDTKITNFLEVFDHTMESMDMSDDEVIKGCKPVHKSTMRRRQLYLPHWSGRH